MGDPEFCPERDALLLDPESHSMSPPIRDPGAESIRREVGSLLSLRVPLDRISNGLSFLGDSLLDPYNGLEDYVPNISKEPIHESGDLRKVSAHNCRVAGIEYP